MPESFDNLSADTQPDEGPDYDPFDSVGLFPTDEELQAADALQRQIAEVVARQGSRERFSEDETIPAEDPTFEPAAEEAQETTIVVPLNHMDPAGFAPAASPITTPDPDQEIQHEDLLNEAEALTEASGDVTEADAIGQMAEAVVPPKEDPPPEAPAEVTNLEWLKQFLREKDVCEGLGFSSHEKLLSKIKDLFGPQAFAAGPPDSRTPVSFSLSMRPSKSGSKVVAAGAPPPAKSASSVPLGPSDRTHKLLDEAGTRQTTKEVEARLTLGGAAPAPPEDSYLTRSAALVLLRTYVHQGKFLAYCGGHIIFEDDGVQYPADTRLPLKRSEDDTDLLNIVSLWLLVSYQHRYEAECDDSVLRRLGALLIPRQHREMLLDYLMGRCDHCHLLLPSASLQSTVPVPAPTRLPKPTKIKAKPVPPLVLRAFPGTSRAPPVEEEGRPKKVRKR